MNDFFPTRWPCAAFFFFLIIFLTAVIDFFWCRQCTKIKFELSIQIDPSLSARLKLTEKKAYSATDFNHLLCKRSACFYGRSFFLTYNVSICSILSPWSSWLWMSSASVSESSVEELLEAETSQGSFSFVDLINSSMNHTKLLTNKEWNCSLLAWVFVPSNAGIIFSSRDLILPRMRS